MKDEYVVTVRNAKHVKTVLKIASKHLRKIKPNGAHFSFILKEDRNGK